jgi:hypothetical protein
MTPMEGGFRNSADLKECFWTDTPWCLRGDSPACTLGEPVLSGDSKLDDNAWTATENPFAPCRTPVRQTRPSGPNF